MPQLKDRGWTRYQSADPKCPQCSKENTPIRVGDGPAFVRVGNLSVVVTDEIAKEYPDDASRAAWVTRTLNTAWHRQKTERARKRRAV